MVFLKNIPEIMNLTGFTNLLVFEMDFGSPDHVKNILDSEIERGS